METKLRSVSNSSSHPLPCCGTECESRGCFASFHALNPNTCFQYPDVGCLWANLWTGSAGQPCPLLIPSPGRKTWVHHHLALEAVPSHKGGVLLPTVPMPVSCLTLKFCASAVQTGWVYRRVFQASFPSMLYGYFFVAVVLCSFSKAACFLLAPGLFWFGLSKLP